MAEAPGIRAWLCRLIQKALERVRGPRRLNRATSADRESVSIRSSTKHYERQTESLTATHDPSSSSDSSPASDVMATPQDRKAASGDETPPELSNPAFAFEKLQDDIGNAIVHKDSCDGEFVPESTLKHLMGDRKVITKVLEELRSNSTKRWETPVEKLVSFIAKDAYKVFALLVFQGKPRLIEQFYRYRRDFRQEMLPVKISKSLSDHPTIEPYDGASRRREGLNCDILRNVFDIKSVWKKEALRGFCLHWQWLFFPPVFVEEQFRYLFPNSTRLPFTRFPKTPKDTSSPYSTLVKKSIHNDHIQTTIPLSRDEDGNPLVALKMLKSDDPGEADREAVALETINGFKSKHLIRTLAYFRLHNDHWTTSEHYFMFPWAEKGNLWEFWQRRAAGADRKYILDVFGQLAGLACALDELSSHSIRHGDLKPENILCFKAEDGLPEGDAGDAVRLVIADAGLARVHAEGTSKRGVTDTTVSTMRYASPELGPNYTKKLSRRFDVWSMGCIYLEFLIWVLYGMEKLIEFSTAPSKPLIKPPADKAEDEAGSEKAKARFYENDPDRLGVSGKGAVRVHWAAREWLSIIRGDERCSEGTAFRYLADLISEKLLDVELGNRAPPESQTSSKARHGEEELHPNPETGAPGIIRTEPPTSPTDDNTNKSDAKISGRVYAPDMKDELMKIVDGLADGSILIKESALAVRVSSGPRNGETTNGSVNNRVRN